MNHHVKDILRSVPSTLKLFALMTKVPKTLRFDELSFSTTTSGETHVRLPHRIASQGLVQQIAHTAVLKDLARCQEN